MGNNDIEKIEIDLLLEAIFQRYGYDFRSYARASIERRIRQFMLRTNCKSISEMIPKLLQDNDFFSQMARYFSITVTEMFRDPQVFQTIREQVVPLLKTWPHFKIWHAGCATGEEVYSLAIILKEEGIYNRATIYATDFNDDSLDAAREGIYDIRNLKEATKNYQTAGGKTSLSDYYHSKYNSAIMDKSLKERITFANHNLAVDEAFGEMHLIFCRNVLIYFNRELQNRVLNIFTNSIVNGGILCLGTKESIQFTDVNKMYSVLDGKSKIYKKDYGI